jgi:hypothetical protein
VGVTFKSLGSAVELAFNLVYVMRCVQKKGDEKPGFYRSDREEAVG